VAVFYTKDSNVIKLLSVQCPLLFRAALPILQCFTASRNRTWLIKTVIGCFIYAGFLHAMHYISFNIIYNTIKKPL
jgi:hypothetical protein